MRAVLRGDLIYRGGRHVAALRDGCLWRTFDAGRELLRGALLFHFDVLELAAFEGCQRIIATERATGLVYRIAFAEFAGRSWPYVHPVFGAQRGVELSRFERLPKAGEAVQLGLFAEVGR
jgi:hypothetical protein